MIAVVTRRLSQVRDLCEKHQVRRLALFGSAARAEDSTVVGDLDFLVEFNVMPPSVHADAFFSLQEDLERLFGMPVDLVESGPIRNPYLIAVIEESRAEIFTSKHA